MSQQNPVLYGNRLYSRTTYSTNADPETFMVILSDAVGSSDAQIFNTTKVLTDLVTMMDAIASSTTKPLSDTVSLTETFVTTATKVLNDNVNSTDAKTITATKALAEAVTLSETFLTSVTKPLADTVTMTETFSLIFAQVLADFVTAIDSIAITMFVSLHEELLLQDWLSIRLAKPQQWNVNSPVTVPDSLYGIILYGPRVYSGLNSQKWVVNTPNPRQRGNWRGYNELNQP